MNGTSQIVHNIYLYCSLQTYEGIYTISDNLSLVPGIIFIKNMISKIQFYKAKMVKYALIL